MQIFLLRRAGCSKVLWGKEGNIGVVMLVHREGESTQGYQYKLSASEKSEKRGRDKGKKVNNVLDLKRKIFEAFEQKLGEAVVNRKRSLGHSQTRGARSSGLPPSSVALLPTRLKWYHRKESKNGFDLISPLWNV